MSYYLNPDNPTLAKYYLCKKCKYIAPFSPYNPGKNKYHAEDCGYYAKQRLKLDKKIKHLNRKINLLSKQKDNLSKVTILKSQVFTKKQYY